MNTLDHTVHATSGSAAAVTRSTPAGTGITCPAGTATRVGVAAAGQQGADLVAHRPAVDAVADGGDRAAALQAEDSEAPGGGG